MIGVGTSAHNCIGGADNWQQVVKQPILLIGSITNTNSNIHYHISHHQHIYQYLPYEEIEQTFKFQILKLFSRICMANLIYSFTVLKVSYEVGETQQPTVDSHHVMGRLLHRLVNTRKKILYDLLAGFKHETVYWRTKACVMMKAVLQRRINCMEDAGLARIRDQVNSSKAYMRNQQWNPQQEYLNIYLELVPKILSSCQYRILADSFLCLKVHGSQNKNIQNIQGVHQTDSRDSRIMGNAVAVGELLGIVIRRRLLDGFRSITGSRIHGIQGNQGNYGTMGMVEEDGGQDMDEQDIQISQIKSIILVNLSSQHKHRQKQCPTHQQYCSRTLQSILGQFQQWALEFSFNRIKRKLVEHYDEEMMEKLETEITVLQHQFDSL